jgi:hypothetical protein
MFNREETYKIKASEFNKFKEEYTKLVRENEELKAKTDRGYLIEVNAHLSKTNRKLLASIEELENKNASLEKTIKTERATTSLVLQKLKEVTDIYERSYRRDNTYVTSLDLRG